MTPDDRITITLTRADWEDVVGGMWRAAADTEHAATLPDYEPDEQEELRQDAIDYRRIGEAIEKRFDTANKLPRFLREVEKIAETWDAPDGEATPYEPDAANLLTGLVEEWRRFCAP